MQPNPPLLIAGRSTKSYRLDNSDVQPFPFPSSLSQSYVEFVTHDMTEYVLGIQRTERNVKVVVSTYFKPYEVVPSGGGEWGTGLPDGRQFYGIAVGEKVLYDKNINSH